MIFLNLKQNNYANNNADNQFINTKAIRTEKQNFHIPVDPRIQSWDSTPDDCEEMVNTYGTYEIQPTNNTDNRFPAISQSLPSENVEHKPQHFHEGIIPDLNDKK